MALTDGNYKNQPSSGVWRHHSPLLLALPLCHVPTLWAEPGELNLHQHFSCCHSQLCTFARTAKGGRCRCTPGLLSRTGRMNLCYGLGIMEGRKNWHLKHPSGTSIRLSWYRPSLSCAQIFTHLTGGEMTFLLRARHSNSKCKSLSSSPFITRKISALVWITSGVAVLGLQ